MFSSTWFDFKACNDFHFRSFCIVTQICADDLGTSIGEGLHFRGNFYYVYRAVANAKISRCKMLRCKQIKCRLNFIYFSKKHVHLQLLWPRCGEHINIYPLANFSLIRCHEIFWAFSNNIFNIETRNQNFILFIDLWNNTNAGPDNKLIPLPF